MGDWFMTLVLQRFHQHSMAIQKAEQLVTRGMTGLPMIITKIAACSNARHDHDQAISNFEDVRKADPYRLGDLHLLSDSLYIRNDQKKLSTLAIEVYKVHKFRWETCCIVELLNFFQKYPNILGFGTTDFSFFRFFMAKRKYSIFSEIFFEELSYGTYRTDENIFYFYFKFCLELINFFLNFSRFGSKVFVFPIFFLFKKRKMFDFLGNFFFEVFFAYGKYQTDETNYHAIRRDSEHAIKFFQRALRLNPGLAALWVLIGHEFMEMKNNAAACVSYRRAIEIDPADHRGWYGLGQMYDIMKMPAYALFYYQEAQKCKPHDSRLLVALGDIYSKLNRIEDAEKCFTGAYLFGDVEGNALWSLAKLHERYSDDNKAAQAFEVFLVVYELVTSAEEKIIYAIAFLANHFFKIEDFDKASEYATKCLAFETKFFNFEDTLFFKYENVQYKLQKLICSQFLSQSFLYSSQLNDPILQLCQEGNRLFREIAKIQARESRLPVEEAPGPSNASAAGGQEAMDTEEAPQEGGEEEMSEGEDDFSF
nr:hypothetical protein F10C5.1 - Caenorhabditis elegans [Caenorhabditis elegans]